MTIEYTGLSNGKKDIKIIRRKKVLGTNIPTYQLRTPKIIRGGGVNPKI